MKKICVPILLSIIVPLALAAKGVDGKSEVCLHGYVTDAVTKKPVPGVVVSASVPGLNISKEVKTDADGYFSFTQLCGNQVNIQFEKKGYQSLRKSNVAVKEKAGVKVNIEFTPEYNDTGSDENDYPILRMLQMN
ncbi:MAG TPA: carboxypeptidase-like regulatory domain-containing protein [Puia sp.]|nr:carboxypeptidase-like regulatory domain-containing protein [Puia sp.]